jgi:hypothetical protein
MHNKKQDRAPRGAHGQAANTSVPVYSCSHDKQLTEHEFLMYRSAALIPYQYGEPRELTRARNEVDSWCQFVGKQFPLIPPRGVAYAMQLRGYQLCN